MSAAESSGGNICIGCGLCCDGTLHGRTTVRPDDELPVAAAGLEVAEEEGKRFFRQPCPRFSCGSCTIYEKRPGVCRTYRCALLIDVEEGKIGEADAREKIATAKTLVAAVRLIDPTAVVPASRSALAKRLAAEVRELPSADRHPATKALLDVALLEHFLNRWFLKDKAKKTKEQA